MTTVAGLLHVEVGHASRANPFVLEQDYNPEKGTWDASGTVNSKH